MGVVPAKKFLKMSNFEAVGLESDTSMGRVCIKSLTFISHCADFPVQLWYLLIENRFYFDFLT